MPNDQASALTWALGPAACWPMIGTSCWPMIGHTTAGHDSFMPGWRRLPVATPGRPWPISAPATGSRPPSMPAPKKAPARPHALVLHSTHGAPCMAAHLQKRAAGTQACGARRVTHAHLHMPALPRGKLAIVQFSSPRLIVVFASLLRLVVPPGGAQSCVLQDAEQKLVKRDLAVVARFVRSGCAPPWLRLCQGLLSAHAEAVERRRVAVVWCVAVAVAVAVAVGVGVAGRWGWETQSQASSGRARAHSLHLPLALARCAAPPHSRTGHRNSLGGVVATRPSTSRALQRQQLRCNSPATARCAANPPKKPRADPAAWQP